MNNEVTHGATTVLEALDRSRLDADRADAVQDSSAVSDSSQPMEQRREATADRRTPSLKSFVYGAFNPRRRRIRRAEDTEHTFLDWHPRHLLVISCVLLVLSMIDGLLTVFLVENRVTEFSRFIPYLGGYGPVLFALTKFLVTAVIVVSLVLTAHMRIYRIVRASTVLYGFMAIYLAMLLWQLSLARAI